jgi:mono/diheme cytochrome c family protein
MPRKTLLVFVILAAFAAGCLSQPVEVGETLVPKKTLPVHYPEEAKSTSNPIPADDASIAIGKAKFEVYCVMCHGHNGGAGQEITKGFEIDPSNLITDSVKKRTDGELFWATSNGVNDTKMLPWSDLLSDEEIWHIINYIRVLQKEA